MGKYILIAVFIIILGLVGNLDYQDEIKREQNYINMVCDGFYPNYKKFEIDCGATTGEHTIRTRWIARGFFIVGQ